MLAAACGFMAFERHEAGALLVVGGLAVAGWLC
jgi:hypothetical protein